MENTIKKEKTDLDKQYPSIGNFINYYLVQNNIKKTEVAKALGLSSASFTFCLKQESIQFDQLWKLSLITKHNFLAHLGEYLPYRYETMREKKLQEQLAEKEALIQKMEIQLEVYRDLLKK